VKTTDDFSEYGCVNILIDIIHPAHVHFFRHAIDEFQKRGHQVAVTAREKDVTISLLENFEIPYTLLSRVGRGRAGLLRELIVRDWRLWRFCKKFRPDVLTGISGVFIAHVGWLLGKPSVVWDDTEHQKQAHAITWPLATMIQSPDCYSKSPIKKQVLYPGCHELAYLHPNRFTPDAEIVKSLGIDPSEKYCIIRLVSWGAHHDVGQYGLADSKKLQFVKDIAQYAKVYITSEGELPGELEPYRLNIPVHQIHHVLAFASMCVAEGATVASEANMLGTPAVYINSLKLGYIDMLEDYGMLSQTTDTNRALDVSIDWLKDDNAIERCKTKRNKFLDDKIDVTDYIINTVERVAEN
jgi:uncharacterized protein